MHGIREIEGRSYVGDTPWMYWGNCHCGWTTDKDPSWRSAGERVEAHARDRARNARRMREMAEREAKDRDPERFLNEW